MVRFSMYGMAGVGVAAAVGFVLILSSISSNIPGGEVINTGGRSGPIGPVTFISSSSQELKKFSSVQELTTFLASIESGRNALIAASGDTAFIETGRFTGELALTDTDMQKTQGPTPAPSASMEEGAPAGDTSAVSPEYSTTNVQVKGVDEPDFVKNDGKYAYILSGDRLTIAEVYPAESAKVVSKVGLDIQQGQYLQNMFINDDTLVVFYQDYAQDYVIPQYDIVPQPFYTPKTHVMILDVADRADPKVAKNYVVSGAYNNARMIGDYVYLVTTSDLYNYRQPLIPKVADASTTLIVPDIYYFDNPEPYYNFNTVTTVNIKSAQDAIKSQTFMMNPASALYVSENNIYIAYQKYQPYYDIANRDRFFNVVVPLLPQDIQQQIRSIDSDQSQSESQRWDRIATVLQDMYNRMGEQEKTALLDKIQKALSDYDARIQKESHRTVVHKIAIGTEGEISYVARGEVPGRLLNQFSMDENGDRFRVATTVEYYSRSSSGMYNNVYVLNEGMQVVGKLEQIAPDESIYSARFIGDRLYLVTFQRIDPFFVIDVSTDQPKVLGELKLPGYSSYLHPYDENHIIGIGKETKDNEFGGVQTSGVKIALFDVSDVSNPKLLDDHVIGNAGTDSDVLWDHKAFLFDRTKDVLSIPITSYEDVPADGGRYIQPKTWRGFYVFSTSPDSGFALKGTVEHSSSSGEYYYGLQGSRSFYIGDVLYTLSLGNKLKMNDIDSLAAINELEVGSTGGVIPYPMPEPLPR
jgi:inhibitor of cysteine peptidase